MTSKWTVKRQTEIGSKQWGVYRNGQLVEGGFFDIEGAHAAKAELAADEYRFGGPNYNAVSTPDGV